MLNERKQCGDGDVMSPAETTLVDDCSSGSSASNPHTALHACKRQADLEQNILGHGDRWVLYNV